MDSPRLITYASDYWTVLANSNLVPTKKEKNFKGVKGVIAQFGKNPFEEGNVEKLMYVNYPVDKYTKIEMEENIMPQYDSCPLCKIGREKQTRFKMEYGESKSFNWNNVLYVGGIAGIFLLGGVLYKRLIFKE